LASVCAVVREAVGTSSQAALVHTFANDFVNASAGLPNGELAIVMGGSTPWFTNGTAAGTLLVPGVQGLGSDSVTTINGRFFLELEDPQHGAEFWQSNGTVSGTTLIQDINPGPGWSDPTALTELNGRLLVAADDGVHGLELMCGPMPRASLALSSRKPARTPNPRNE